MIKNTSLPASSSTPAYVKTSAGEFTRLVTNDIYLAAYLLCEDCQLDRVYHNGRKRAAFEFAGYGLLEKKKAYKKGRVFLNVGSFRAQLNHIRSLAYGQERSLLCPTLKQAQA